MFTKLVVLYDPRQLLNDVGVVSHGVGMVTLEVLAHFQQLLLHGSLLHLGLGVVGAVTLVGKPRLDLEGGGGYCSDSICLNFF